MLIDYTVSRIIYTGAKNPQKFFAYAKERYDKQHIIQQRNR